MNERVRQTDALAEAFRKRADQLFLHFLQPAELLHVADAFGDAPMRHAFERGAVIQIFRHPHVGIERHVLRHVTEMRPRLERLLEDVEARDRRATGRRRHEARENPHRGALARAVRPEEAHDLAFADLEAQVVNRRVAGVAFSQVLNLDHAK